MSRLAVPPLPQSGKYISSVRESCRELRIASGIEVRESAVEKLLGSAALKESFTRLATVHGLNFPLAFPSLKAEINFLGTLALLNFGSGYRAPLHAATGRGAYDNIRLLLMGMYIDGDSGSMSARGWTRLTDVQIASLMNISLHQERPHESIPGLVVGERGGPLNELVGLITRTLKETGEVLVEGGYEDLGAFVVEALEEAKKAGGSQGTGPSADVVLERLVKAIPGFQDMAVIDGRPVYVFKKAMFLVHAIALKFGAGSGVAAPDTSQMPVFSDNVLPSMLVHLGVLDLSGGPLCLREAFPGAGSAERLHQASTSAEGGQPGGTASLDGPALGARDAYILRAAGVDACEMIVRVAGQAMTLPELDGWLWSVAKDRRDYRALARFAERGTVYY